jgi:hypothetical protein
VDEKKLVDTLTQIVKQLQEIANTMGVSTGVDNTGGKKGKKKEAEKALNTKEQKKAEETAEIYNKKLNIIPFFDTVKQNLEDIGIKFLSSIKNSISRQNKKTNDFFIDLLFNFRNSQINQKVINENLDKIVGINQKLYDSSEEERKKKKAGVTMDKFKNILGLLGLGAGLYLIIQALTSAGDINISQILKVLGVMVVIVGLFIFISKVGSNIQNAAIAFGIISATVLFLVLPLMDKINKLSWDTILQSVLKMGLVMVACVGIMFLMGIIKAGEAIKASLGLGILILGIQFLVIPFLEHLTKIDMEMMKTSLLKFGGLILPLIGIMFLMGIIKAGEAIKASLGIVIMIGLLGLIVIPFFEYLATLSFEPMLMGLLYTGLAILGLSGIAFLMGKLIGMGLKDILIGAVVVLGFTFLMGFLVDQLTKFADKPWKEILIGLGLATLAITAFGLVVAGIGALVANPVVATIVAAGGATVLGLILLMSGLAESLAKFKDVDAAQLEAVGKALLPLSVGLLALLGGSVGGAVSGIVNGLTGLFKIDPVSQIKKFETIDSEKIYKLGMGLKFMGEGLKTLSSGEIKLKDVVGEILLLTKPLIEFSGALNQFSEAYSKFDKVAMNSDLTKIYKMKVENDNTIQKAIMDLNQQELAVQQAQLEQLKLNGEFLKRIAEGGMGQNIISNNMQPQGDNISAPSFKTKDNYFTNLKLSTMSVS